jgi:hypothetical protein
MRAHDIAPDAEDRSPIVQPVAPGLQAVATPTRGRGLYALAGVAAIFSVAASAAVLFVLWKERDAGSGRTTGPPIQHLPAYSPIPAPDPAAAPPPLPLVSPANPEEPADPPPPQAEPKPAARPAPAPRPIAHSASLAPRPSDADVAAGMKAVEKQIEGCGAKHGVTGEVAIKMRIEPDGKIAWAAARRDNPPFQGCLDRLFRKARMAPSSEGGTVRTAVTIR